MASLALLDPAHFELFKTREARGQICPQTFPSFPEILEGVTCSMLMKGLTLKESHHKKFYRPNLIFWIVMGSGEASFGQKGQKKDLKL